jgi:hypothetical protein
MYTYEPLAKLPSSSKAKAGGGRIARNFNQIFDTTRFYEVFTAI